ncbi:hypothetical protein NPIL_535961 [Nephila pilipes]|uniref:Uncharacterized protein n=1 Tax=Nephila pilipes TaxID=299642 RepID=A0A8X6NK07_NEPPI|nr:hypothetical protein NPIL_535961 [Nephila pilipes]
MEDFTQKTSKPLIHGWKSWSSHLYIFGLFDPIWNRKQLFLHCSINRWFFWEVLTSHIRGIKRPCCTFGKRQGVLHLAVEIRVGIGYDSLLVSECKRWQMYRRVLLISLLIRKNNAARRYGFNLSPTPN